MERIIYRKTLDVHKNGIQFTLQGFETADNLSRRIEVSFMASGDTYELPIEGVVALMYTTSPNAKEPSIEECTIKDNTIIYDVLPIVEEGTTEMQLKLIETRIDGAKRVLAAPRFAVEVLKSNTDDESVVQSTSFTALENAVAKASAVYNIRLTKLEVDENCIFKAHYADGTVYETDSIQKMLLQVTTDMDLTSLVKDGLTNFTASELASELDERYNYAFAKAIYSDNLAKVYDVPTFVRWDKDTANTPFNANPQLTEISDGFAMCYGDTLNHTIVAWVVGDKGNDCFTHKVSEGIVLGWDSYINKSGGTMTGDLILNANPISDMQAATKQYADGASLESYYAFCANVNSDSIDCAFGKNNEDKTRMLGLQMAMYAWFKGDSKTEYPFTELIKCQTLNDLKKAQAFSELASNNNLLRLFMKGLTTGLSYPSETVLSLLSSAGAAAKYNSVQTFTDSITVTQDMLDGITPVLMCYRLHRALDEGSCSYFYLNDVVFEKEELEWPDTTHGGYQYIEQILINWKDYNITSPGDYEITIKLAGNGSDSVIPSSCAIYFYTLKD